MIAGAATASALTVDSSVSDHCVLLQNAQNTVKGRAAANSTVTVQFGGEQVGSATADASGKYAVTFDPGAANATGRDLVVSDGSESQTVADVLVGEVWFVTGQSNAFNPMDGNVMAADYGKAYPVWKEEFECPNLRVVISTPKTAQGGVSDYYEASPSQDLQWIVCQKSNEDNVKKISPLAFFFGKKLSEYKNCPVGIALVGMGGTAIGWHMTDAGKALAKKYYGGDFVYCDGFNLSDCYTRTDTIAARGAIWAQGCGDASKPGGGGGYRHLLRGFVEDWRNRRNEPNFPILVYGLANYDNESQAGGEWRFPRIRWEQEKAVSDGLIAPAAVFHTIDLSGSATKGYAKSIHPDQKQEAADRALLAARNLVYGESEVAYRCPNPTEAHFNSDKSKIHVTFPSSVALTMDGNYTHIPFRLKNRAVEQNATSTINPTSVQLGADGHSLEIAYDTSAFDLNAADKGNSIEYCYVAGTEDKTYIYEQRIKDQNGFPMPPFSLAISNVAPEGGETPPSPPPHTHAYGEPTYVWAADHSTCTARAECTESDCSDAITETVNASADVTQEPTAEETGICVYKATFMGSDFQQQVETVTLPKLSAGPDGKGYEYVQLWQDGPYWATVNVGATSETDFGTYFSWGSTTAFDGVTCETADKTVAELADYLDENGNLKSAYDAASVNMGGDWRMPTAAEMSDLYANCDATWDSALKGTWIQGRGEYASERIFLPNAGYHQNGGAPVNVGAYGFYLSSTPAANATHAQAFQVMAALPIFVSACSRNNGYVIRGVLPYVPGAETHTHTWGNAVYTWSEDDSSCTAVRTCTDPDCGKSQTETVAPKFVTIKEATTTETGLGHYVATFRNPAFVQQIGVDIVIPMKDEEDPPDVGPGVDAEVVQLWENGPYWAKNNLGAEKESGLGAFFMWGETSGYTRCGAYWVDADGVSSANPFGDSIGKDKNLATLKEEGIVDEDGVLAKKYDAANAAMGGDWRLPTKEEIKAIATYCTVTETVVNGVKGVEVRGTGAYAENAIFIPCNGYGEASNGALANGGVQTYYLTSTPVDDTGKFSSMFVTVSKLGTMNVSRSNGYQIRPVRDTAPSSSQDDTWDVPGTTGGINALSGEDGRKYVRFSSISVVDGKLSLGLEAAKIDANGQTFGLICKESLTDKETFTLDVTLSDDGTGSATTGALEGLTDKASLFVLGIGPAK